MKFVFLKQVQKLTKYDLKIINTTLLVFGWKFISEGHVGVAKYWFVLIILSRHEHEEKNTKQIVCLVWLYIDLKTHVFHSQ